MKRNAIFSICLASALCASASGQPTLPSNRLDIMLEGPWILYQDMSFQNDLQETVPVLIAIAPSELRIKDTTMQHQPPTFMVGDGYQVLHGVNCVIFDGLCGRLESPNAMQPLQYPAESVQSIKHPNVWSWSASPAINTDYYLILPMPDSYSTDGMWPMRFAPGSDPSSKPEDPIDFKAASIGVHLHYYHGPTKISLKSCAGPFPNNSSVSCTVVGKNYKPLDNTGTLRIVMKAPSYTEPEAVCDPHVRAAYRQMLLLIDPTPFSARGTADDLMNVNHAIAWIDPARGMKTDGTPIYDDIPNTCRDLYDNGLPISLAYRGETSKSMGKMGERNRNLYQLVSAIAQIDPKNPDFPKGGKLEVVQNAIVNLDAEMDSVYPRISQLALAAALAQTSSDLITEMNKIPSRARTRNLPETLNNLLAFDQAYVIAYDAQTKDGKDCLAPILTVGP